MEHEYKIFYIPKSKGYRKIVTYVSQDSALYKLHTDALRSLKTHIHHSPFAKAYIEHRSIITNAQAHLYNDMFICLDIHNFFQSINHKRLIAALYYEINKTSKKQFNYQQCEELVKSCSLSKKGIAIGLKPSPDLANIYLKEFDTKLYAWLKQQSLKNIIYTRYADDITISFKDTGEEYNVLVLSIIDYIKDLLRKFYLELNSQKTRILNLNKSNHVRITGINLTKDQNNYRKLTVGRKRKNQLFFDAIDAYTSLNNEEKVKKVKEIKGMQAFVLSIEGENYENTYSDNMKQKILQLGFPSLKALIDAL